MLYCVIFFECVFPLLLDLWSIHIYYYFLSSKIQAKLFLSFTCLIESLVNQWTRGRITGAKYCSYIRHLPLLPFSSHSFTLFTPSCSLCYNLYLGWFIRHQVFFEIKLPLLSPRAPTRCLSRTSCPLRVVDSVGHDGTFSI